MGRGLYSIASLLHTRKRLKSLSSVFIAHTIGYNMTS